MKTKEQKALTIAEALNQHYGLDWSKLKREMAQHLAVRVKFVERKWVFADGSELPI